MSFATIDISQGLIGTDWMATLEYLEIASGVDVLMGLNHLDHLLPGLHEFQFVVTGPQQ